MKDIDNPKNPDPGAPNGNLQKDPDEWVTGDEPMTQAQASYLKTLSEEAGETFDGTLSKADASKRIDELQAITGRGTHGNDKAAAARTRRKPVRSARAG